MELVAYQKSMELLDRQLKALDLETAVVGKQNEVQVGDTLRILLPVDDEGNANIMEVMLTPYEEDADLVHIYTTMLGELSEADMDALLHALPEWNILCPLGAFGLYAEGMQYYHKYTFPISPEVEAEALADHTMTVIELVYDILADNYPKAAGLIGGGK